MKEKAYPLKMKPYLEVKIWGGDQLVNSYSKEKPVSGKLGETWEISDIEKKESLIDNGPLKGKKISEAKDLISEEFHGKMDSYKNFPLMVKFIDASDDLSIQVHPSAETIETHSLNADPKDECWYILETENEEGGFIFHGLNKNTDQESFKNAVKGNSVSELMNKTLVKKGDMIHVPPGTPHAILKGISLLEVQQPSDTTYRVYDYGRLGNNGKPRDLHIDNALKSINFSGNHERTATERVLLNSLDTSKHELLLENENFRLEKVNSQNNFKFKNLSRAPLIMVCVSGKNEFLDSSSSESYKIKKGDTYLLPATEAYYEFSGNSELELVFASHLNGQLLELT